MGGMTNLGGARGSGIMGVGNAAGGVTSGLSSTMMRNALMKGKLLNPDKETPTPDAGFYGSGEGISYLGGPWSGGG